MNEKSGTGDFLPTSCVILHTSTRSGGFALLELIIAVALFGVITAFILLAYNRVGGQLFLSSLAYEIALSLRQAQSFGVSVREFRGSGSGTFDVGYGLHFDAGSVNTYALFADQGGSAGNGLFDGGFGGAYDATGCLGVTECVSVFKLERGNTIARFCAVLPAGDGGRDAPDSAKNEECNVNSLPSSNPTIAYLDVVFLRPNPDAMIKTSQTVSAGQQYRAARIYLTSPTGEKRVVEAVNTGQISIK